jgi:hypothetical protein
MGSNASYFAKSFVWMLSGVGAAISYVVYGWFRSERFGLDFVSAGFAIVVFLVGCGLAFVFIKKAFGLNGWGCFLYPGVLFIGLGIALGESVFQVEERSFVRMVEEEGSTGEVARSFPFGNASIGFDGIYYYAHD